MKLRALFTWLPLITLIAISIPIPRDMPTCLVEASSDITPVTDYCYRFKVTATNNSGSTLPTDYPIAFTINSGQLSSQGFLDAYLWDIRPVNPSLEAVDVTAQNRTGNPARWWFQSPSSVANGANTNIWVYIGSAAAKRNQGFIFGGSDTITVAGHADLDFTDDFEVIVTVASSDPAQDAWFVSKYDVATSSGYRFGVIDDGGTSKFRAVVDNQTLDATSGWTGDDMKLRMQFDAPNLYIHKWDSSSESWSQLGSLDTGLSNITANAEDLVIGESFSGLIREVELRDNVGSASYAPVARWGMQPDEISETSASDPTYTGTVQNELNAGTHDGTYNLSRSQSGISITLGPIALVTAKTATTVSEQFKDIMGDATSVDLFSEQTTLQRIPFYSMLADAQAASGMPDDAFWILVTIGASGILATGVFMAVRSVEIAAVVPVAAFIYGGLVGLYPPWVAAVVGFAILGVTLTAQWRK